LLAWLFPHQVRKLKDPRIAAVKPYQARYAALRQRLRALAAKLPAEVDEMRPSPPLDPPVNYSTFGPVDARNTDGLMYEQLLDPDVEGVKPFGVQISTFLAEALRSSGPRPPLHGSREFDDPARLVAALERGLQLRYLAVSRVLRHDPIVLLSYRTFTGGTAQISGVLVDLQTDAVRCAFGPRRHADPVSDVREGSGGAGRLAPGAGAPRTVRLRPQRFPHCDAEGLRRSRALRRGVAVGSPVRVIRALNPSRVR